MGAAAMKKATGSDALLLRILKGRIFVDVLDTTYLTPPWDPAAPYTLLRVDDLYKFFSSRRRHTRYSGDWSSDVCSSDLRTSGGERLVGRNRAMLPAERDGSESQRLPQRPSGIEARDRGVAGTDLAFQRLRHVHAVRFGQLGHRAGGAGADRLGIAGRPSGAEKNFAMADRPPDFQEGRLVGEAAQPRARRMGVRVF